MAATDTETRTGVYEAMFLANQAAAASFGDLIAHINHLFERANADVLAMKKWDERRLAFEIEKQKRGVYILAYFTCPTDMVAHLERDVPPRRDEQGGDVASMGLLPFWVARGDRARRCCPLPGSRAATKALPSGAGRRCRGLGCVERRTSGA